MDRRLLMRACVALLWLCGLVLAGMALADERRPPVIVGLTAEFGVQGSHAAQSIEKGILLAIDEINAAGGVLGGRPLRLETRDDRGVPARGIDNYEEFAMRPEVVAVFCGRFSPVAIEVAQLAPRHGLPLLDPWAAADPITESRAGNPGFAFRLSLKDTWAVQAMLDHARARGLKRLALFVPNTAWGRSNEAAVIDYEKKHGGVSHEVFWYNWGDSDFRERIALARARDAQALLMVANEMEGLSILRQVAVLPADRRLPIISHWGILGGDFAAAAGEILERLDLVVVHTFSFSDPRSPRARAVADGYLRKFASDVGDLRAQVGFAHAYDLTHLLARAIDKAGTTDRAQVRHALERLGPYDGLVRNYQRPFAPGRHEALDRAQVRMARFGKDGNLQSLIGK